VGPHNLVRDNTFAVSAPFESFSGYVGIRNCSYPITVELSLALSSKSGRLECHTASVGEMDSSHEVLLWIV
jgi:hypothetical protein